MLLNFSGLATEGEDLEEVLCHELYDTFNGKGLGVYEYIFKALSERGGPRSLEMMEVINHELYPRIQTRSYRRPAA